ncbi:hypothetical protein KIPE111705_12595 [Kibdelosporangium persicum]|uniref:LigA protein n=1 Tax=Kibdelosporangium persicum TaxID=2698649 RepID=A0ABX2F9H4_9PSEU|nr:hypothetical protein [Kibdelosporangium persicum]NRN68018.1 hypothetical protein [Kibdelosporangium persicum]
MITVREATPAATRPGAPGRVRTVICWVTIASCLPYLVLKVFWLFGNSVGAADAQGAAELLDVRHLVGDVVTAGMELFAIALVLALTYPWGRLLPAWLVAGPIWLASGLLAPIALGLPLGLAAQAFVGGSAVPADNGLLGWVYVLVYGGFAVQAVGLLAAFLGHARERWPEVFRMRMTHLSGTASRHRLRTMIAATIAAGYAAIMVAWSVTAPDWGGPAGFETVAQKTALLATGLLVLAGAISVPALLRRRGDRRVVGPFTLAWLGTSVAVTAGPTHIALSNNGSISLILVTVSLCATLSGLLLAHTMIRALPAAPRETERRT